MARKLQVRRGTAANMPVLADGELGFQTDTGRLFVGNGGVNVPLVMETELDAHTSSRDNPHGVTAQQVGARPNTWVPSKADVGLGNVDNTADSQKSVNYANSTNYANTAGNANALGGRSAADFYNAGNKPFVIGSYMGDSTENRFISLGFTPSAILISGPGGNTISGRDYHGGLILPGLDTFANDFLVAGIREGGFVVNQVSNWNASGNPMDFIMRYIAFR